MIRRDSTGDTSGLAWFKSSYSDNSDPGDCVEVALAPRTVHVRDSKDAEGPRLALAPGTWARFVSYASED
ncbi:DUF397 domain-containing protein [Streptomyces sp. 5-8]|uniref:DUF397 domain-containing protein n=1 Tax=Streptomyces musisoli TaxID=2802280 RepID=A0ABS1PCI5_9ACTN|nr:DUF397 domain-containing protein [Streptomyces musisoli]MBL1110086.1 DUF397 domain-containing protein [Streptomyces musisoli]